MDEQTDGAAIQELVMERAEDQFVVEIVRSIEVEPADVGRSYADWRAARRAVVAAEGRRTIPRGNDLTAPARVPFALRDRCEDEVWVRPAARLERPSMITPSTWPTQTASMTS